MKFKSSLLGIALVLFGVQSDASHVTDRKIYATDIMDASGNSIFYFPTTLPTASRACYFNSNGEPTSSATTDVELGYLSGVTSSVQTQINGKQSSLTIGNLTTSTNGITVTGGTGSVIGSGVTLDVQTATNSVPGLLSAADHTTFSNKQSPGNYITALTGDVTASGPGSSSATLANTSVTAGSYTNSNITVDSKGRITSATNGSAGGVTSVTGTSPIVSSGGSTPAISITHSNLTDAGTDGITVTGGTGAVIGSGTSIAQASASGSQNGYLKSSDWTSFNGKQNSLSFGNLSSSTTGVSVTGGTGSVIGSGTSISVQTASGSQPGLLSAADWTTFNSKGSGTVTSVTGTSPISSSGGTTPAISLNNTAVTPGSYTSTNLTVDAQGRITAASNGSGGGAVSSVSNSDGSLTVSPTTGSVVASLNPAHANTFTTTQTMAPSSTSSKAEIIKRKASSSVNTWEIQNPSGTPMFYADNADNIDVSTDLIFHNIVGGSLVGLNNSNHLVGINSLTSLDYNASTGSLAVTPAGSNTQLQFNNSGVLGANSLLNWDNTNYRLGINKTSPAHTVDVVGDGLFEGISMTAPLATSASGVINYSEAGGFNSSAYQTDGTTQRGYQLWSKKLNIDTNPYFSPTGLSFGPFVDNNSQITTPQVSSAATPVQNDFAGSYGPANGTTNVEYQVYSWQTVNGLTVVSSSYLYMNMGGDNNDGNNYGVNLDWSAGVPTFSTAATATGYFLIRQVNGGGYNDYMVPPGVTFTDDGSTGWNIGTLPTLTPTSIPDFYQITLSWTPVTDSSVTGYRLFYSPTNFTAVNCPGPNSFSGVQVDGSGSYTANGSSYNYSVFFSEVIAGVTIYTATPAGQYLNDNNDGQPFSWQLNWSPATLSPGASSPSYIVQVDYNGTYYWQNVGNVTSFLDSGAGYTYGPATVTPNSTTPIFYVDLSGYTTSSFTDTSYNILSVPSVYPPTPIASTPTSVNINPVGAAIDIQGGYQLPALAPPNSGYFLVSGSGDVPMAWTLYNLSSIPGSLAGSQLAFSSGNGNILNYGSGNLNTSPFTFDAGVLYDTVRAPTFLAFNAGLQISGNPGAAEWQIYSPYANSRYDLSFYNIGGSGGYGEFMHVRDDNRDVTFPSNNVSLTQVGKGLGVKEGTNGKQGVCTLVAGTCTVSTNNITSTSRVFLTAQSLGTITIPAALAVSARTPGTSFTILSSNLTDTSVVAYEIFESP